jgi:hypothetical protein
MTAPTREESNDDSTTAERTWRRRIDDWLARDHADMKVMSLSLLFLLAGLLIVWFAKAAMAFEGNAVYVALLVIPFAFTQRATAGLLALSCA